MKKMFFGLLFLAAGLGLCGYLVHRNNQRARTTVPASDSGGHRPMNEWQKSISLDTRTDYTRQEIEQAMEKLRQEERRQKPEEGRN
ncbi:hypothetical protein OH491_26740 [Termitidicoccus mucosus]|uniref:Uncharacterized protein n=1 Tax=Termitidicoccus mucosus TaxID=1184151 RepID=A0A178IDU5_9BACT|nr:hypothetical protein AW736_24030 [Opitutaceae bacterium TSB47]